MIMRNILAVLTIAGALAPPVAAAPADTGKGTAVIKGTVTLIGAAPAPREVSMQGDPHCAKHATDEQVVAGPKGQLKNVVVRITKGLTGIFPAAGGEVFVDQRGCRYDPHVQVARVGQTVTIKNSDPILHNVHGYKGPTTLFNQAQIIGGAPIIKQLPAVGEVIKLKCDIHPWMAAYVVVTDNPFFAVSDGDGNFTIKDLPAGTYTIDAWHEHFGSKQLQVAVEAGKTATIKLELAGAK